MWLKKAVLTTHEIVWVDDTGEHVIPEGTEALVNRPLTWEEYWADPEVHQGANEEEVKKAFEADPWMEVSLGKDLVKWLSNSQIRKL